MAGPELAAIRTVLAKYRSTEAHITEEEIMAAWAEHDRARRLVEAQDRLIWLLGADSPDLPDQVALARRDIDGLTKALAASEGTEG